jgi:hypothetical protein
VKKRGGMDSVGLALGRDAIATRVREKVGEALHEELAAMTLPAALSPTRPGDDDGEYPDNSHDVGHRPAAPPGDAHRASDADAAASADAAAVASASFDALDAESEWWTREADADSRAEIDARLDEVSCGWGIVSALRQRRRLGLSWRSGVGRTSRNHDRNIIVARTLPKKVLEVSAPGDRTDVAWRSMLNLIPPSAFAPACLPESPRTTYTRARGGGGGWGRCSGAVADLSGGAVALGRSSRSQR